MICDFIIDPVMFVHVMFNDVPNTSPTSRGGKRLVLDAFQKARFRIKCFIPDVIDSSGFGTGKSLEDWLVAQWECCVLGDRWIWVYYQTFETGKAIFWPYYRQFNERSAPLYAAQLGKLDASGDFDGKDNTKGPACYVQHYQEGGQVALPAPGWFQSAKSQAGLTFNRSIVDEWTKVEMMTPTKDRVRTDSGEPVSGIDQQIVGRVRRQTFNQFHPIWGNHRLYSATAESPNHPSFKRVKVFLKQIALGNPNYALTSYNFKHFSNLPSHTGKPFKEQVPNWQTIKTMKEQLSRSHYLREVLGIWQRETTGFYSEDSLNACVQAGIAANTQPEIGRDGNTTPQPSPQGGEGANVYYFSGWDPAPAQSKKADDGAGAAVKLTLKPGMAPSGNPGDWKFELVWAYRLRGLQKFISPGEPDRGMYLAETARKWAGFMHLKHQHFGFNGIMIDPQAGGQGPSIIPELNKPRQLIRGVEEDVMPIAQLDEAMGNALYILSLFKRRDVGVQSLWTMLLGDDNLIDAAHGKVQEMIERGELLFPKPFNERPKEETAQWPVEKQWALKNLDAGQVQFRNIEVATNDNGTWKLTGNGAKQFSAKGKKDIAYAIIMAVIRALIWLKMNAELEFSGEAGSDTGGVMTF